MITLAFIGGILVFFLLDLLVLRRLENDSPTKHGDGAGSGASEGVAFEMPRGYFFHQGHVWVRVLDSGRTAVGIDDFTRTALGRVDAVTLPGSGQKLTAGDKAFELKRGGRTVSFVSPLSGTVARVNPELVAMPGLAGMDPYGRGWVFELEPDSGPVLELADLSIGDKAADWMREELNKLRAFIDKKTPGALPTGFLAFASDPVVSGFQSEFLSGASGKEG